MSTSTIHVADLIETYLQAKDDANKSDRTIQTYRQRLVRFAGWLGDRPLDGSKASRIVCKAYLTSLQDDPHLSEVSIAGYMRDVITFLNWCVAEEYLDRNPARGLTPSVGDYFPASYNADHLRAMLNVCDVRDRAIILFLCDTGLRAKELLSLTRRSVNMQTGHFTVIGKRRKQRSNKLKRVTLLALRAYLDSRTDTDPALWYGRSGPLHYGGLYRMLHRRAVQAGIRDDVRRLVHSMRATFAKHLRKRGADLGTIAQLLGQSTLEMAHHYSKLVDDELMELKERYDPLGEVLPDSEA
jgi:integrase/recombinase XerD